MMKKIKIKANGKIHEVDTGKTIADFVAECSLNPRRCLVELNGAVLKFDDFENKNLSDGDILEVMSLVAGG